jgi:AP-1 complex subunit beta-1
MLTVRNATTGSLSQFAIQVNKNSFGLAPLSSIFDVGNGGVLNAGLSVDVNVPMETNRLNSGTPPGEQLTIQIAVRTSIDIFYFVVPFDLHVVLVKPAGIDRSNFAGSWEGLKASERVGQVRPCPRDRLVPRLFQGGLREVNMDNGSVVSVAASTSNKLVVLAQVDSTTGKFSVRTSNSHLSPHAAVLLSILLGVVGK